MTTKTKLTVIDGETLMDMKLPPTKFCVDTLLPQGLCILGGASKIGKSWWVLDLCVRIAKGEPMWDLKTTGGTTLYLCLEDTLRRKHRQFGAFAGASVLPISRTSSGASRASGCPRRNAFIFGRQPEPTELGNGE